MITVNWNCGLCGAAGKNIDDAQRHKCAKRPNWKSLGRKIGNAVRDRMQSWTQDDFRYSLENLKRAADRPGFWNYVGNALATQRRIGAYEGAEAAKRVVREVLP